MKVESIGFSHLLDKGWERKGVVKDVFFKIWFWASKIIKLAFLEIGKPMKRVGFGGNLGEFFWAGILCLMCLLDIQLKYMSLRILETYVWRHLD